jgi:hypothetical protein
LQPVDDSGNLVGLFVSDQMKRTLKATICPNGHKFRKSSDCPVCPVCEAARKPEEGFLSAFAAPARRALERAEIRSVHDLSRYSEKEIMALHGMGKSTLTRLQALLAAAGLKFRE